MITYTALMMTATFARLCLTPVLQSVGRWQEVNLMHKLAVAISVVLLCGMAFVSALVARNVGESIVDRFGAEVALYADSFVAPLVQELAGQSTISDSKKRQLDSLFAPTVIGRPIVAFRIWSENQIVYSNNRGMIGRRFPGSHSRTRAWNGGVSTELNQLGGDDDVQIRALGVPILEVYAPLRQAGTGRIIGLAETYEIASDLHQDVRAAQMIVWLIFGGSAAGILSLLFIFAGRGATELSRVNQEKDEYRLRVGNANRRISEMNEQHMRLVGTELYRGPVQLVGLALLKLDSLRATLTKMDVPAHPKSEDVDAIRCALNGALDEIRSLSESLVPSKLYELSLSDTIATAVRRHERRVGTSVKCEMAILPSHVPFSVKACLYRFVREALEKGCEGTDAHTVRAECQGERFELEVRRTAAKYRNHPPSHDEHWLQTFRDRVESIGGVLLVQAWPDAVSYTAQFNIHELEAPIG